MSTWMDVPVKRELVGEKEDGLVWTEGKTQAVFSNLHLQGWTGSRRTGRLAGRRSTEKGKRLKHRHERALLPHLLLTQPHCRGGCREAKRRHQTVQCVCEREKKFSQKTA